MAGWQVSLSWPGVVVAHLLIGSPIPLAVQWLLALLCFGGALAVLVLRRRAWRIAAAIATACGFAGTVGSWVVAAVQPGPAPYSLRIVSPAPGSVVSPFVLLTVCGVRGDGSIQAATDSAHYLVVFVDGHEVPTVDAWRFGEWLEPGVHAIRVELVTPSHHAFNPPAIASTRVTVASTARTAGPASC